MSDEEKEKNAEAEELEVQEQVQDAPAEEKVAEPSLEEELLKWRDTAMRTAAEYDNYRKRMVKEKEECAKFANQRLLEELLPVIDNFEMGKSTIRTTRPQKKKFKELGEAYEVLSDADKRAAYDRFGHAAFEQGGPAAGGGYAGGGFQDPMDIFAQMFSGMGGFADMFGGRRGQKKVHQETRFRFAL